LPWRLSVLPLSLRPQAARIYSRLRVFATVRSRDPRRRSGGANAPVAAGGPSPVTRSRTVRGLPAGSVTFAVSTNESEDHPVAGCRTFLGIEHTLRRLAKQVGARAVCGYTKSVDHMPAAAFELMPIGCLADYGSVVRVGASSRRCGHVAAHAARRRGVREMAVARGLPVACT
jgi:hypothetical protein